MGTVNVANPKLDLTVRIFDEFYGFQYDVQAQEYDVVYSYFKSIYTTAQAAGNFTVALFRVAAEQNIPVLNLLTVFEVPCVHGFYYDWIGKRHPPRGVTQRHYGASSSLSWSPDVQPISKPWCLCFHHGLNLRVSPRLRLRVKASLSTCLSTNRYSLATLTD
jgi:hypothetical protein